MISNHSPSPKGCHEITDTPDAYVQSKARVFFVRHGKSTEAKKWNEASLQSNKASLAYIGKRQMKAAWRYLKNVWVKPLDDMVMFSNDTKRVTESVQIIIDQLITTPRNIALLKHTENLRTTKKWLTEDQRLQEDIEVSSNTSKLMNQILQQVKDPYKNVTEFILVWHKSNKSWVTDAIKNTDEAMKISFDIENGEIIELDICSNTWEYIDPKKYPKMLFLNRSNYRSILKLLKNISDLKVNIQKFQNNRKWWEEYPIWKLQNDINEYFQTHREAFPRLLANSENQLDLHTFCLENLK